MRRFELGLHTDVCSVHMVAGIPKPVLAGFFCAMANETALICGRESHRDARCFRRVASRFHARETFPRSPKFCTRSFAEEAAEFVKASVRFLSKVSALA